MSHPTNGLSGSLALLIHELRNLLRVEMALARAEVSRGAARMAVGIALIVLAAFLAFLTLLAFGGAAILAIQAQGYTLLASFLIVALSGLILSGLFAFIGIRRIKPGNLYPKKAMANIRADFSAATEAPNARPY